MPGGLGGGGDYLRKPPIDSRTYTVFLSSSADLIAQRDLFHDLAAAIQYQFWQANNHIHIQVVRWEYDVPRRADGAPNAEFVRQAAAAHCTVVLLGEDIRSGTQEELEGVLAEAQTQLAVIWMRDPKVRRNKALREYLWERRNDLVYEQTGPPPSNDAIVSMVKVITRIAVSGRVRDDSRDGYSS